MGVCKDIQDNYLRCHLIVMSSEYSLKIGIAYGCLHLKLQVHPVIIQPL